jgi:nitrous oxidase accessory protein NosD
MGEFMIKKRTAMLRALAITFSVGLAILAASAVGAAATLTVGNATSLPCTGTYATISSAIAAASPGDTIQVCPGTYNESVTISQTLTLKGAKVGVDARTRATTGESIINSDCSPVQIFADNVVLDGFTV